MSPVNNAQVTFHLTLYRVLIAITNKNKALNIKVVAIRTWYTVPVQCSWFPALSDFQTFLMVELCVSLAISLFFNVFSKTKGTIELVPS